MKSDKKAGLIAGVVILTIIFVILVCGCTETKNEPGAAENLSNKLTSPVNVSQGVKNITIKVVKFEPDNPCQGCTNLGNFANETIQRHFPEEYKSGKIVYETVNYQDAENIEIVRKYNVVGSSLYITVIKDGKEEINDANDMWNYVGDEEEYLKIFKNKLENLKNAG
jgi:hypothetical protein